VDRDTASTAPAAPRIRLLGRGGCHLCDEARAVVDAVARETGEPFVELDVDDHPDLLDAYSDLVPVVFVDGVEQGYWRIDAARVRAALAARP